MCFSTRTLGTVALLVRFFSWVVWLVSLKLQGSVERDVLRAWTQMDSLSVRLEAEDEHGAAACGLGRVLVERGHPAETD